MRRKIFICFFVVLLMTTLVVPAFASSNEGSSFLPSDIPAVPIDYIELLNGEFKGDIIDWPNNFGRNASDVVCTYPSISFRCYRDYTTTNAGIFSTLVYPGDASSVRLFCSNIFLSDSLTFELSDDDFEHICFGSISITGSYHLPYKSGDAYALSSTSFSKTFNINGRFADLFSLIKAAAQCGDILPNDVLWLQNVVITFDFLFDDSDADHFFNVVVSNGRWDNPYVNWFNAYRFTSAAPPVADSDMPGLFDWLLESVNAFLNFEIAPDFSLNKIFFIILVIGVLLWFITLLI